MHDERNLYLLLGVLMLFAFGTYKSLENSHLQDDLAGEAYDILKYTKQIATKTYSTGNSYSLYDIGEVGIAYGVTQDFGRVYLSKQYIDPIVIVQPISTKDARPSHARVKDIAKASFSVRIEEWYSEDGIHAEEDVMYIVMERGSHTTPAGKVQAGSVSLSGFNFQQVSGVYSYQATPIVFTGVQTMNNALALVTRVTGVTSTGFSVKMQTEEKPQKFNIKKMLNEEVGFIVMPTGNYMMAEHLFSVMRTPAAVTDAWYTLDLGGDARSFVASMQTSASDDAASIRFTDFGSSSVKIRIEEEYSMDAEMTHPAEEVGYIAARVYPTCPAPYKTLSGMSCIWTCAEGTYPDEASGECLCNTGYVETGTDSTGRRICSLPQGYAMVMSSPSGADVYISTDKVGVTPLNKSLPAGTYNITLRKTGYIPYSTEVRIEPSRSVTINRELIQATGKIVFTTNPTGADVLTEGYESYLFRGTTPYTLTLPAGRQNGAIEMYYYRTEYWSADVEAGKTMYLSFNLTDCRTYGGETCIYKVPPWESIGGP